MKVLNILRKAGIIAVEEAGPETARGGSDAGRGRGPGADEAARRKGGKEAESEGKPGVRSTRGSSDAQGRGAGRGSGEGPALAAPPPPSEAEIAPIAASELIVDLERIFEALKLPVHAHGWTVERVARALESEHFRALPEATRRAALLAMLDGSGAPITDVIDDAVRRDQALDAYAAFARKKLEERLANVETSIAEQEAAIAAARQTITSLEESRSREQAAFAAWLERKTGKEEEYARVVALLTDERVISVGEAGGPGSAGPPSAGPSKTDPKSGTSTGGAA